MSSPRSAVRIPPVRKSLEVPREHSLVFRRFTREIGSWWPLRAHSVGGDETVAVVFEERAGGRVFERLADGTEHDWGRVLLWEPPQRFVMTWHPGRDAANAQELEVRFIPQEGGTRIELTHSGWERLGSAGTETRDGYSPGWDHVLANFAEGDQ